MRGPSAIGGDFHRFVTLTITLAVTEFKLRFFGSVLGYLWQLMRPLMLFGVLYLVFTEFVRLGGGVDFFAVVLLTNIVLYTFVAEATSGSVSSLADREGLVRKIQFPRLAIPLSVVLTAMFNLSLNVLVIFAFLLVAGVDVRWTWLELPLLIAALGLLATGLSLILSTLYVRYRDVRPIWDVLLQVTFYLSPILYVVELVPVQRLREAMMYNPLAVILQQTRHAVIDPSAPSAAAAAGGAWKLLAPALFVVALVAFGAWLFNREAPRIAEEL